MVRGRVKDEQGDVVVGIVAAVEFGEDLVTQPLAPDAAGFAAYRELASTPRPGCRRDRLARDAGRVRSPGRGEDGRNVAVREKLCW
jgi:hypothetical protein